MTWLLIARRFWWAVPILALLMWGLRVDHLRAGYKADLAQEIRDHARTQSAFDQTVQGYRAASDLAKRAAQANVVRVKAEQSAITERATNDLESRLAATGAAYDRLRSRTAAADPGSTGEAAMPGTGATSGCPYGAADCAGLLTTLKEAEDNTSRLVALQSWVAAQAAVNNEGK